VNIVMNSLGEYRTGNFVTYRKLLEVRDCMETLCFIHVWIFSAISSEIFMLILSIFSDAVCVLIIQRRILERMKNGELAWIWKEDTLIEVLS
jgi:hypothetical protein